MTTDARTLKIRRTWLTTGTVASTVAAGLIVTAGTGTAVAAAPALDPFCSLSGGLATCTYPQAGTPTLTLPSNMQAGSPVTITAVGGAGSNGNYNDSDHASPFYSNGGGRGASVSAAFHLTPGTVLDIRVSGFGGDGGGAGAFNRQNGLGTRVAGAGGGWSGVTIASPAGVRSMLIAGGGGGAGAAELNAEQDPIELPVHGGAGGNAGLVGQPAAGGAGGEGYLRLGAGQPGLPGTPTQPGLGGAGAVLQSPQGGGGAFDSQCSVTIPSTPGGPGATFVGGGSGNTGTTFEADGGGGGGGYKGGGSGGSGAQAPCYLFGLHSANWVSAGGGGGGGSSYVDPAALPNSVASSIVNDTRSASDPGSVVIAYVVDTTAPVVTIAPVSQPLSGPAGDVLAKLSEPVTRAPELSLTRDGQPVDLTIGDVVSGTLFYGISGDDLTSPPGTYVFTADFSGSTDVAGNAVTGTQSITWVNSLTAQFGTVDTPRASGVGALPVTFSAPVTGVDIADFRMFRDGVQTGLTGVTIDGSGADYTLHGLDVLTQPESTAVDWELELLGSGTGISAGSGGDPDETSVAFEVSAAGAPVPAFDAVPTPRDSGVDQIGLNFSVPVYGLDIGDFRIFRDGIATPLTGASLVTIGFQPGDGSAAHYLIVGLTDLTSPELYQVEWELQLRRDGSNITGQAGQPMTSGTSVAFVVHATPPVTAAFDPITTPRDTGVDTAGITFSVPAYAVDITDFQLLRNGVDTPLDGVTVTRTGQLPSGASATFDLEGLGAITAPELYPVDWTLVLRDTDTFITGEEGQDISGGASVAFTVNAAVPPTAFFTPVTTPRDTPLDGAALTFSQPVFAVDPSDLSLTRNGIPVALDGVTVSGAGADYTVSGLGALTAQTNTDAAYVLTLADSGTDIVNGTGTALAGGASLFFTVFADSTPNSPTAVVLSVQHPPSATTGTRVTAIVTVPAGAPVPTGTITFTITRAAGAPVTCRSGAVAMLAGAQASCVIGRTVIRPGNADYVVTAQYSGDDFSDPDTGMLSLHPSGLTSQLHVVLGSAPRSAAKTTIIATVRPTTSGLPVDGHGRIAVFDAAGNRVRCQQFQLIPSSPKFGCTIAAPLSVPGSYRALAIYYGSRTMYLRTKQFAFVIPA